MLTLNFKNEVKKELGLVKFEMTPKNPEPVTFADTFAKLTQSFKDEVERELGLKK